MKKILIIKPPYNFVPLGIGYVLSCLERANIPFDFWDTLRPENPEEYYLDKIENNEYLAVATGGYVYNLNFFIEISEKSESLSPDTPFILGGNITRNVKIDILFGAVKADYIYKGEVEVSFPELVKHLATGTPSLEDIPGVCYKNDQSGEIKKNPGGRVDLSADFLMPAYHLMDIPFYIDTFKHHIFHKASRMMFTMTGRGCTGGCSFCSPTVGKFMARPYEDTMREIEYLNEHYDFESFGFVTEIFFQDDEQIFDFCEAYKTLKIQKPWYCMIHPHITPAVFPAMREAGCFGINMGLESGSDPILAKLKAGCTVAGFKENLNAARSAGIAVESSFMVGNESETEEDLRKTFDFLIDNRVQANFSIVSAYPGTSIFNKAKKRGQVEDELEYMQNVMSGRYWRTYNIAEFPYMNISNIPDDRLFETVGRDSRRYLSFQFHEFQAQNVEFSHRPHTGETTKSNNGGADQVIDMNGECIACGTPVSMSLNTGEDVNLIELSDICTNCFTRNFFDLTKDPAFKNHYDSLEGTLCDCQKILVFGRGKNADSFYFYDIFNIGEDKVIGFVDERTAEEEISGIEEHSGSDKRMFYHLPRYAPEDVKELDFDVGLVTDITPEMMAALFPDGVGKPLLWLASQATMPSETKIYKFVKSAYTFFTDKASHPC